MITAFYTRNVVEKRLDVVFQMKSLNFSFIVLLFQSKPVPNILDLFLLGGAVAPLSLREKRLWNRVESSQDLY